MLANPSTVPRPRPPAKMRRSSTMGSIRKSTSPPPPYASDFVFPPKNAHKLPMETLPGPPVQNAAAQMVEWDSDGSGPSSPRRDNVQWFNEASREELSELLVKADGLIRKREDALDRTSTFCKTLYEDNLALQTKHRALLTRIPATPTRTSSMNLTLSPSPSPISHTPSNSISSISRSNSILSPYPSPPENRPYIRKISVSPEDIYLLSDQNAELLAKLEKLESESTSTDLFGRRMLRKLEKEIALLREELEMTQAKNEELAQKTKAENASRDAERAAEELARKKRERESRVKALRSSVSVSSFRSDSEVRDFAPGGPLSIPSPTVSSFQSSTPESQRSSLPSSSTSIDDERTPEFHHSTDIWNSPPTTPPRTHRHRISEGSPELAVVSQLLMKIQELEAANARIMEQQLETANKLQAVQRDTENMSKVYESLNDFNGEMELVEPGASGQDEQRSSEDSTMRFKSFRKTLEDSIPTEESDDAPEAFDTLNLSSLRKNRKSVIGLFNSPDASSAFSRPTSSTPVLFSDRRSWSLDSIGPISPALSPLGLTPSATGATYHSLDLADISPSPPPSRLPSDRAFTLQSELGSEYGEDWSFNAGNHHLRTSSLYDFSQLQSSAPPSPSVMSSRQTSLFSTREAIPTGEGVVEERQPEAFMTPLLSSGALQLTLVPPTPQQNQGEDDEYAGPSNFSSGSLRVAGSEKHTLRQRRMTQTIRARTTRWVDGRFTDTVLSPRHSVDLHLPLPAEDMYLDPPSPSTSIPVASSSGSGTPTQLRSLANALDMVVEKFTGRPVFKAAEEASLDREDDHALDQTVELYGQDSQMARQSAGKPAHGVGTLMLELWLWLQFIIIILLFLWAMAKKGPKSVLGEAEQRKAVVRR